MGLLDNWQEGKTLSQTATMMFDEQVLTDVTFTFQNFETIKAHRFVLMARSCGFMAMFHASLDKPRVDIEISDVEPAVFKEFLKYLYTDEVTFTTERALQLSYCADKYKVTELKEKCMDFLACVVVESTVATVLDHAVLHNDKILISTCRDIIEPLKTLSCLEEHHVTKDTMELILGFDDLAVGELDIFKFSNTWAENECKRMEVPVNADNKRNMLGAILQQIPFCSMHHEDFATEVVGKHLLHSQEEMQIFRYICAPGKSNPPFPCRAKKETIQPCTPPLPSETGGETKQVISVRLPNIHKHSWHLSQWDGSPFQLRVCCDSRIPYTLLGLKFTKTGNYKIVFEGTHEERFTVKTDNPEVFLKTPVPCHDTGIYHTINSISPVRYVNTQERVFTHLEQVEGQACPIQIHFCVRNEGIPPIDTLIMQI